MLSAAALDSVPAYASGINPDGAAEMVARSRVAGFRSFKLKIGFGKEKDLANIVQIVDGLIDGELFMADANQAWDLSAATEMAGELAETAVDLARRAVARRSAHGGVAHLALGFSDFTGWRRESAGRGSVIANS